jgi:hypothetical protein
MTRHLNKVLPSALAVVLATLGGAFPNDSAGLTRRAIGFDDMVRASSLIVQGRVLRLESFRGGGAAMPGAAAAPAPSTPPATPPAPAAQQPPTAPSPPVDAGATPGRMIFTRVTMEASPPIKGSAGRTIDFVVAGGTVDGRTAVVPGMPTFEVDGEYVLFLKDGYRSVADPVVGVNQGFFRVVDDATSGQRVLLNADADYILGVEADRVVTRHNPQRPASGPLPAGPPVPDRPGIRARMSPELERYWHSTEPLMTVGEFVQAIRSRTRP